MTSESNRRTLSLGGGKYILASRMRADGEVSDEVLTRAGRYHLVKDNLRVKEVYVGDGERRQRYVVCYNPSEGHRQRARRAKHLEHLRAELAALSDGALSSWQSARATDLERKNLVTRPPPSTCAVSPVNPGRRVPIAIRNPSNWGRRSHDICHSFRPARVPRRRCAGCEAPACLGRRRPCAQSRRPCANDLHRASWGASGATRSTWRLLGGSFRCSRAFTGGSGSRTTPCARGSRRPTRSRAERPRRSAPTGGRR